MNDSERRALAKQMLVDQIMAIDRAIASRVYEQPSWILMSLDARTAIERIGCTYEVHEVVE